MTFFLVCQLLLIHLLLKMSTDLKRSPREASDCPIFGLCNCGHVHITTTSGVDDINDLWLPFRRDLQHRGMSYRKHCTTDSKIPEYLRGSNNYIV